MLRSRALAVSAVLAVATVNLLTACTPEDDNDVFATPTPPALEPPVHCQVVWMNRTQSGDVVDVFVIDAPEESWTLAGTGTFEEFVGYYQPQVAFDPDDHVILATLDTRGAMVASTGTIAYTIFINTTDDGSDLEITDFDPKTLLAIDSNGEATTAVFGSTQSIVFDGVWSTRDPGFPVTVDDDAEVVIALPGTSGDTITIGSELGGYALCYEIAVEE